LRTPATHQPRAASAEAPGLAIETVRLRIRSLHHDDLADLVALIDNWEIARWVSSVPYPYTEADGREWIERVRQEHDSGRPRRFAIALKETDRYRCEAVATVIDYGFRTRGIDTMRAHTDPSNAVAKKSSCTAA